MFGQPDDGRVTRLVDAAGETWEYAYNVLGSLTAVNGPGGVTRTWTYDPASKRLATETHPESGTVAYTHDAGGVLAGKVDANGTEFLYTHDGNDRVRVITAVPAAGPAQVTTIDYEPGSDRRAGTSVEGVSTAFEYDHLTGRLEKRTDWVDGLAFSVTYAYDAHDNVTGITYPSGRQVAYEYDGQHRIARVANAAVPGAPPYAHLFVYHPSGALAGYTAGNGVSTTLGYHPLRQWLETVLVTGASEPLTLLYGYDGVGNITQIDDSRPGRPQAFTYDVLTQEVIREGSFTSVRKLVTESYLADRNLEPKVYRWRGDGAEILRKIQRARQALEAQQTARG